MKEHFGIEKIRENKKADPLGMNYGTNQIY